MSTLIEELRKEHAEIGEALARVKELGIVSKEAQDLLLSAKEGLLAHLKKEDERLYPVLQKKSKNNDRLKFTLDMFAKDMNSVSKSALEFFDKYANGGDDMEFSVDFGAFLARLKGRIRKEETIIYAEYEKLTD